MPRKAKIKIRRGLEPSLTPGILEDGEFGLTTDTWKLFIGLGGQNIFLGEVGAFGDMLKSVYDTDNDGIVDQAEKVEWSGILNKAIASESTLGLIKIGSNLSVTADGVVSGNSIPESFIPKSERFTVLNGQTTFNLKKGYYTPSSLTWSVYGYQQPKEAITEISSTSFSIPPGLPDNTEFEVQYIQTVNLQPFPYHKGEHLPGGTDDLGLKTVALSGSYNDLDNKPIIPSKLSQLANDSSFVTASNHSHSILSVLSDNYKDSVALPSVYPRGATLFFSNNPLNKFNNIAYCTVTTIKSYSNMACIQYLYPYNIDSPIYYRYGLYNSDTWKEWRALSIEGHKHSKSQITDFPSIPTKLSELENDIGAGGGAKITTSQTAPINQAAGDFWYKEL